MERHLLKQELAKRVSTKIYEDEPLAKHTTWKIGGPADFLVEPGSVLEFTDVIHFLVQNSINYRVIGNGSNILVLDKGFRGVIIKTKKLKVISFQKDGEVYVEAGVLLPALALKAANLGYGGLEELSGIPGTIGGAVRQNAGANGKEIKQLILKVEAVDESGHQKKFSAEECSFNYRSSRFKDENLWIVSANLKLNRADPNKVLQKIKEFKQKRKEAQPIEYPNAGSVFKNPESLPAWKLIKEAGAQGLKKGGAVVSEKHANFIVNTGNATAGDVLYLINKIQEMVWQRFSVKLMLEVEVIGE